MLRSRIKTIRQLKVAALLLRHSCFLKVKRIEWAPNGNLFLQHPNATFPTEEIAVLIVHIGKYTFTINIKKMWVYNGLYAMHGSYRLRYS